MESKTDRNVEEFTEFEKITESKDMKVIWDSQNEEKLYAVNEDTFYNQIKRKGKSVNRLLQRFEILMIGVNIVVAIVLIATEFPHDGDLYGYLLPNIYIAYAVLAVILQQTRRRKDVFFEKTITGELDKAIWQITYLIERSRELMWWYLLPLTILTAGEIFYDGQPLTAFAIVLAMGGVGVLAARWKVKKKYLPKKQSLESLRTTLLTAGV